MFTNGTYRILYIKEGIDYLPIGCLTENSFSEDSETLDTTTRENGGWRTSQPTLQSFNIDFSGLQINTRFTGADLTKISYDKLKELKRNRTLIEWKIENTDLVFLEYGKGYVTSLSEVNGVDEMISFSGSIEGFGEPVSSTGIGTEFIPNPATDWILWNPTGGTWANDATNPGEYIINDPYAVYNGGQFGTVDENLDFDIHVTGGVNFGTIGFTTSTSYGLHNSITLGGSTRQIYIGGSIIIDTGDFPFVIGGDYDLEIRRRGGYVSFYATDSNNVLQLAYTHTEEQSGAYNIFAYSYAVNLCINIKITTYE